MTLVAPTVLCVEDDPDDVFFLRRALRTQNIDCQLQIVSNVSAAKCYLSGKVPYEDRVRFPVPALLLTHMTRHPPGESSFDLIAWIQSTPELATLPILCATDNDQPRMLQAFANHGVACHPKSGQMLAVADAVKTALDDRTVG